ncbi:hypothetical protein EVAR_94864_1 [Eumeta japonica]|uniref:Uncharacterized protein n=1 Tax=Eumeta variegata TaxID=151549 RepID=A0A4C1V9K7_EUMVA|nr:hypothetical protein EVAR_94864_1 [Eumeta japonica]
MVAIRNTSIFRIHPTLLWSDENIKAYLKGQRIEDDEVVVAAVQEFLERNITEAEFPEEPLLRFNGTYL